MNPQAKYLLARKSKADSLPAEVKQQYSDEYDQIIIELLPYTMSSPLLVWDDDIYTIILRAMLGYMAQKYEKHINRPFVNWVYFGVVQEIDASFEAKDSNRFFRCIQKVRQQLSKI
ncbi:MAG: hypothetical protein ACYCVD_02880 [Desulfitobacteriaceae bacterium]